MFRIGFIQFCYHLLHIFTCFCVLGCDWNSVFFVLGGVHYGFICLCGRGSCVEFLLKTQNLETPGWLIGKWVVLLFEVAWTRGCLFIVEKLDVCK